MRAVRLHEHKGIQGVRVEEVEQPVPGFGEVLLDVRAAGVNPVDWKIAEGELQAMLGHTLPITLGCDVSGTVAAVGADVAGLQVGDEAFGYVSLARCGGYADAVIALPAELARKPEGISHEEAAAIPVAALTSWQALFDTAGLREGQTLLVHAAAGGVGSIAVQLAKARGARVVGTASGGNEEFVRGLGVDRFVDYRSTRFEDAVQHVDVVLDTVGGDTQERSFGVLRRGGHLVSIVHPPDEGLAARHGVSAGFIAVQPDGAQLTEIARMMDARSLRASVARTFPLEDGVDALEQSREGHTRGKLVLVPSD